MDLDVQFLYTETIICKLCPPDVYVCQFQMYERISFNIMHVDEIHLIISRAADNVTNTCTCNLNTKSHNINRLCVRHNPEPVKHIQTSSKMLFVLAVCIAFIAIVINL